MKRIIFRVDASIVLGYGHVMRCLTLAMAMREQQSVDIVFLCRELEGHLIALISGYGFQVHALPNTHAALYHGSKKLSNRCLEAAWGKDVEQCKPYLSRIGPDWLIVDHYMLGKDWEHDLTDFYGKLLVIDDLVNRTHECDMLLDQTLGRSEVAYQNLVPMHCTVLTGIQYALLRPEFSALREYSLSRRCSRFELKQVLVSMGGIDQHNVTHGVLEALQCSVLPRDCHIVVVLSSQSPALDAVIEQAKMMAGEVSVKVDVKNMAQLMADSDLAIGAAGTSSWERCCLGLPSFLIVVAENQWDNAKAQVASKAALLLGQGENALAALPEAIEKCISTNLLAELSAEAGQLCDGAGVRRVLASMEGCVL